MHSWRIFDVSLERLRRRQLRLAAFIIFMLGVLVGALLTVGV